MYLDALGGGEKYMLSIASYLSEKHDVDLFWDYEDVMMSAQKRFSLNLSNITLVKNIFSSPLSFFEKKKIMQSYDVIIYLSDGSIPFLFGKKNMLHFQFPTPWVKGNSFLTKIKLKTITRVVCNSAYTKSFVDETFHLSSSILYPPCTLISSHEKKENIILTVGRLNVLSKHNDFKKLEKMIEIFKEKISPNHKQWKLILVVTFFEEDKHIIDLWKKEVENLPIEILTNIDYEQLSKVYGKAKIYWHAAGLGENLKKHPERAEHFGIAPVEAMSAGAVPVVINKGGIPEIVDDNKDGLVWNTEQELVEKTEKLLTDEGYRERLASEAIKKAAVFSETSFKEKLFTIIDKLT